MAHQAERAIIRILGGDGPVGIGILVAPDLALTCRHVVAACLRDGELELGVTVDVDFPLLGSDLRRTASVHYLVGPAALDVVGLRLDPPSDARPARIVDVEEVAGRRVSVFGVDARRPRGAWAEGVMRGRTADGRLQLDDDRTHGVSAGPGFSGGPVVDEALGAIVGVTVEVESRADRRTSYALSGRALHDAWPQLGDAAAQENPFRGLEAFQETDKDLFFGRDRDTEDLLERLNVGGVLTVTGPSGCGKSSLVLAGLFPRLRDKRTLTVDLRPAAASNPWSALAAALGDTGLVEEMKDGHLADVTNRILVEQSLRRLVILVDQLDEGLVRYPGDTPDLLDALLDVATRQRREPRVDLIVTVNARHLDDLLSDTRFSQRLRGSVHPLGVPNAAELRDIVDGPLAPVGMPIYQDGLPDLLLDDVADQRNPLPLLEFALTLLWDRQKRGVLTHEAYRDFEGVAGAIATYAEEVWRTVATDEATEAVGRWLFCQLVSPLPDGGWTRRAVALSDLGDVGSVASDLASTRLVTLTSAADGEPTVELAHEALIRLWPRFRDWAEEERDFRAEQDGLDQRIDRWDRRNDRSQLLRGRSLRAALRWDADTLTERQRDFLARSTRAAVTRWSWRTSVAVLLVAIIAVTLVFARNVRREQDRREDVAAAEALLAAESRTTPRGLGINVRAFRTLDDPTTRAALQNWYAHLRHATLVLPWYANAPEGGPLAPDGTLAATASESLDQLDLYDVTQSPPTISHLDLPPGARLEVTAWIAPHHLALQDEQGIGIWDLATGTRVRQFAATPDGMIADPTGRWLGWGTIGSAEFNVADLAAPDTPVTSLQLPGRYGFIEQGGDEILALQMLDGGEVLVQVADPAFEGRAVATPTGVRAATAIEQELPDIVDPRSEDLVVTTDGQLATVRCRGGFGVQLDVVATGATLAEQPVATPNCDGSASGPQTQAIFSPDGEHVALVDDGAAPSPPVLAVGPVGAEVLTSIPVLPEFRPIDISPNEAGGYRVALRSGFSDGLVILQVSPDELDAALQAASDGIVTPDGRYVVLRFSNKSLETWDTATRRRLAVSTAAMSDHPTYGAAAWDRYTAWERYEEYAPGYVPELTPSSDSELLAVTHNELDTVSILRLPDLTTVGAMEVPGRDLADVEVASTAVLDFTAEHKLLVRHDETYSVWSATGERLSDPITLPLQGQARGAGDPLLLPERDEFVAVEFDAVQRYRLPAGRLVEDATMRLDTGDRVATSASDTSLVPATLDEDGRRLALALIGGVEVWNLGSGEREGRIDLPSGAVATDLEFGASTKELHIELRASRDHAPLGVLVWRRDQNAGLARFYGAYLRRQNDEAVMADDPLASGGWELAAGRRVDGSGYVLDLQSTDPEVWLDHLCGLIELSGIDSAAAAADDLPDGAYDGPLCPDDRAATSSGADG